MAASAETQLVGKGTVLRPIGNCNTQEAYHVPCFSSNIVPVHALPEHFQVLLSSYISQPKACFMFKKG